MEDPPKLMYPIYCVDGPLQNYRFQSDRKIETMDMFGTKYRILWEEGPKTFDYQYEDMKNIPEGYPKTFVAYAATHTR